MNNPGFSYVYDSHKELGILKEYPSLEPQDMHCSKDDQFFCKPP